ncbi:MAG: hypothetical protein MI919_27510 [Holophagales bacterium]|nr:hypothetical protein [Holophagales bacterium]
MSRSSEVAEGWPASLRMNAAAGEGPIDRELAVGELAERAREWALGRRCRPAGRPAVDPGNLRPGPPPDPAHWHDPRVGWGLVLPEREGLGAAELARADDAPEPIRELWRARGGPVLRYRPSFEAGDRFLFLRDWRHRTDVPLDRPAMGTDPGHLPYYLLIAAPPSEVPWEVQYVLGAGSCVGRLHLEPEDGPGDPLGRYVEHLLGPWGGPAQGGAREEVAPAARAERPLIWAVDHGGGDITGLLRRSIALRLLRRFEGDTELEPRFLDGRRGEATAEGLIRALARDRPALVVTTSHGRTGPLAEPGEPPLPGLAARLGLPVDQDFQDLEPPALLAAWQPAGAMWVAHGCCTAGSAEPSLFADLFAPESGVRRILDGISALGSRISPLPRRLLGAASPLRAFVGQVEPTFDWTLRQPRSQAHLSDPLVGAFYDHLYRDEPLGLALQDWRRSLSRLYVAWERARDAVEETDRPSPGDLTTLLYLRLAARDIQSTVILGDPTASLPPLP